MSHDVQLQESAFRVQDTLAESAVAATQGLMPMGTATYNDEVNLDDCRVEVLEQDSATSSPLAAEQAELVASLQAELHQRIQEYEALRGEVQDLSQRAVHHDDLASELVSAQAEVARLVAAADEQASSPAAHLLALVVMMAEATFACISLYKRREKAVSEAAVQVGAPQVGSQSGEDECSTPKRAKGSATDAPFLPHQFLPHNTVEQRYMLRLQEQMDSLQAELRERENRLAQQNELMNIIQQEIMDLTEADQSTKHMNAELRKEIRRLQQELELYKQQQSCVSWSKYSDMGATQPFGGALECGSSSSPPLPRRVAPAALTLPLHTPVAACKRHSCSPRSPFSPRSSSCSTGLYARRFGTLAGSATSQGSSITGNKENAYALPAGVAASVTERALAPSKAAVVTGTAVHSPSDLNPKSHSKLVALDCGAGDAHRF